MDLPEDRRLSDAEIAIGIAQAVLHDQLNPGSNNPFQPGEFLYRIGIEPRSLPATFHEANPHREIEFRVAAQCWRLVGLGYLVPQVSSGWGVFHVTDSGRQFLAHLDPAAITSGGLDSKLADYGFASNDLVRQYARLAQDCFLAGHYESSVVMLGAAAESLINQTSDALEGARKTLPLSITARRGNPTARLNLEWILDSLTTHRSPVMRDLRGRGRDADWIDPLSAVLSGTGQAIRLTRNQQGHPTGFSVTQEDALQLLVLFPRMAESASQALLALV